MCVCVFVIRVYSTSHERSKIIIPGARIAIFGPTDFFVLLPGPLAYTTKVTKSGCSTSWSTWRQILALPQLLLFVSSLSPQLHSDSGKL